MKKTTIILCLFVFLVIKLDAQILEAEKAHELSKDARKGQLVSFEFDADEKAYYLTFKRDKGRKNIYEIYQFDYDFNMVSNETMEEKEARAKYKWGWNLSDPGVPWENKKVVRIGTNPTQITLKLGTITRTWDCVTNIYGPYVYVDCKYNYHFNEHKVVKPKYDPAFDFPEGTPKLIQNMVTKLCERVVPIYYMTDEPETQMVSKWQLHKTDALNISTTDFSKASGDVMVAGLQQYYIEDDYYGVIKLLNYSAKDLSLLNETNVQFKYPNHCFFKKNLPDNTMVMVFMPQKLQKGEPDPNTENFTFMRVSMKAEVLQKINFTSPAREWKISDAILGQDGDIYLYGLSNKKNNGKYRLLYDEHGPLNKAEYMQVVKISGEDIDYISSVGIEEMSSKIAMPSNQKKGEPFDGKGLVMNPDNSVLTPEGQLIVGGQTNKYDAIYYFHFDSDGKFKKEYAITPAEKHKENAIDQVLILNDDKKSLTLYIGELADVKNERKFKYPRMGTIDIVSGTMSAIKSFGYNDDQEYYMDNMFPYLFIGEEKIVFFSHDKKDKEIWLGRVQMGK